MDLLNELKTILGMEVKLSEQKIEETEEKVELETGIFYDGELAEGIEVWADAEMTMPLADGEYTIEGDMIVVKDGKVYSVGSAAEPQLPEQTQSPVEMAFDPEAKAAELDAKIAELDAKIAAIDELLKANNIQMSKMIAEGFEKLIQDGEETEEVEKPVQLTKAMPSVDAIAEPKNAKERLLNKIKTLK